MVAHVVSVGRDSDSDEWRNRYIIHSMVCNVCCKYIYTYTPTHSKPIVSSWRKKAPLLFLLFCSVHCVVCPLLSSLFNAMLTSGFTIIVTLVHTYLLSVSISNGCSISSVHSWQWSFRWDCLTRLYLSLVYIFAAVRVAVSLSIPMCMYFGVERERGREKRRERVGKWET